MLRNVVLGLTLTFLLPCVSAEPNSPEPFRTIEESRGITTAEFHPAGEPMLLTVADEIALWNLETGQKAHVFEGPWRLGRVAHYSPDGRLILASAANEYNRGPAVAYDSKTCEKEWEVQPEEWGFVWSCFSRGGHYAVVSRQYQRLLDPDTGEYLKRLELEMPAGQRGEFLFVRFSPDDRLMFSTTTMGINSIWDVKAEQERHRISHRGVIWDALFSNDGAYLVTVSQDRTAVVWDPATGEKLQTLRHEGAVYCVDISADDSKILTASADGTAALWDAANGKALLNFKHKDAVIAADLSPDGALVLTGARDGSAHLWDARTGAEISRLAPHEDEAWWVRFSPDRQYCVTASADGTAAVYRLKAIE
jgi:WD40 repeat protein